MSLFDGDELDPWTPLTPANPAAVARTCRRHEWTRLTALGEKACGRCPAVRDEAVVRRNRGNRQRGSAFELKVAKALGGRKTGPLGGRDDVMVGQFAAVQTKKTQRLSLTEARTYLADLRRTFPDRVPLVIHALPGHAPDPVVILPLDQWVALHGAEREDAP